MAAQPRLGSLLVDLSFIDQAQLDRALEHQRERGGRLGKVLVSMGIISEERLTHALSRQLGIDSCDVINAPVHDKVLALISKETALDHRVLPVARKREGDADVVFVALADPLDQQAMEAVRSELGAGTRVHWMIAGETELETALEQRHGQRPSASVAPGRSPSTYQGVPVVQGLPFRKDLPSRTGSVPEVAQKTGDRLSYSAFGEASIDLSAAPFEELEEVEPVEELDGVDLVEIVDEEDGGEPSFGELRSADIGSARDLEEIEPLELDPLEEEDVIPLGASSGTPPARSGEGDQPTEIVESIDIGASLDIAATPYSSSSEDGGFEESTAFEGSEPASPDARLAPVDLDIEAPSAPSSSTFPPTPSATSQRMSWGELLESSGSLPPVTAFEASASSAPPIEPGGEAAFDPEPTPFEPAPFAAEDPPSFDAEPVADFIEDSAVEALDPSALGAEPEFDAVPELEPEPEPMPAPQSEAEPAPQPDDSELPSLDAEPLPPELAGSGPLIPISEDDASSEGEDDGRTEDVAQPQFAADDDPTFEPTPTPVALLATEGPNTEDIAPSTDPGGAQVLIPDPPTVEREAPPPAPGARLRDLARDADPDRLRAGCELMLSLLEEGGLLDDANIEALSRRFSS